MYSFPPIEYSETIKIEPIPFGLEEGTQSRLIIITVNGLHSILTRAEVKHYLPDGKVIAWPNDFSHVLHRYRPKSRPYQTKERNEDFRYAHQYELERIEHVRDLVLEHYAEIEKKRSKKKRKK